MNAKYVPILKCKQGEQKALKQLSDEIKKAIMPLIEIPISRSESKKDIKDIISDFWDDNKYFYYFTQDCYNDLENPQDFISNKIIPLCQYSNGIPVFDLSMFDQIENLEPFYNSGLAIRFRNMEFGAIEEFLNPFFNSSELQRSKIDLIFDLQYIDNNELFSKISMLKAAFSDLDKAKDFRSIIISSVSFPKTLPPMESKTIYHFNRSETEIYEIATKLANRFNFNYIYSDYGPANIEEVPYVVGISPNFKIKYTTVNDYTFIKGTQVKKGGLDISNVRELATILVESNDFCGKDFSWADGEIYNLSQGISNNSGNLTTWVSYAMNHHISFIYNQL